jgi:hypothetical protein
MSSGFRLYGIQTACPNCRTSLIVQIPIVMRCQSLTFTKLTIFFSFFFQYLNDDSTGNGRYKCAKCSGTCTITLTLEEMVELGHVDKYGRLRPVLSPLWLVSHFVCSEIMVAVVAALLKSYHQACLQDLLELQNREETPLPTKRNVRRRISTHTVSYKTSSHRKLNPRNQSR